MLQSHQRQEKDLLQYQLGKLESVCEKKLQQAYDRHEEQAQELEQMAEMRGKLADHIVYL